MPRFLSGLAVLALMLVPVAAEANVVTSVKVETYRVSGRTGAALVTSMDRNGPRHGFLARAIAQTRYTVAWELGWTMVGNRCRLSGTRVTLSINYRYPQLDGPVEPGLSGRWKRFMEGVKRHEETHGRLAREMANAADRAVAGIAYADDPQCRKAKAEVTRRVTRIYADYEARQQAFDAREHREGGRVDRLVGSLIGLN